VCSIALLAMGYRNSVLIRLHKEMQELPLSFRLKVCASMPPQNKILLSLKADVSVCQYLTNF
jgi:hypothetical protein